MSDKPFKEPVTLLETPFVPNVALMRASLAEARRVEDSPLVRSYLHLEIAMLLVEDGFGSIADSIRDVMDPIWFAMTDPERVYLANRPVVK